MPTSIPTALFSDIFGKTASISTTTQACHFPAFDLDMAICFISQFVGICLWHMILILPILERCKNPFLISKQHYSYFFLKKTKMNQVAEEGLYM
jgi:hypothetical protein